MPCPLVLQGLVYYNISVIGFHYVLVFWKFLIFGRKKAHIDHTLSIWLCTQFRKHYGHIAERKQNFIANILGLAQPQDPRNLVKILLLIGLWLEGRQILMIFLYFV